MEIKKLNGASVSDVYKRQGELCNFFLVHQLEQVGFIHLIQNYEVIRDSEVMMSKEANSIGKCPLCGSAVAVSYTHLPEFSWVVLSQPRSKN